MSTSQVPDRVVNETVEGNGPTIRGLVNNPSLVWGAALISALLIALYYRVIGKLVTDWWEIPDFSHGFLVLPFAAYLVWVKRKTLRDIKASPSWWGVGWVAAGLLILLLGVYGAELFLSRISFLVVLTGLILTFGGRTFLAELRFALLVLLLAIPIPAIIFNQITLPLQTLAAVEA